MLSVFLLRTNMLSIDLDTNRLDQEIRHFNPLTLTTRNGSRRALYFASINEVADIWVILRNDTKGVKSFAPGGSCPTHFDH